jgi:hypothetical protein
MHRDPGDTAPEPYPASYTCPLTRGRSREGPAARMGTVGVHLLPVCRQLLATAKKISHQLRQLGNEGWVVSTNFQLAH